MLPRISEDEKTALNLTLLCMAAAAIFGLFTDHWGTNLFMLAVLVLLSYYDERGVKRDHEDHI